MQTTEFIKGSLEHELSDPLCDSVNKGLDIIPLGKELNTSFANEIRGQVGNLSQNFLWGQASISSFQFRVAYLN